MTSTPDLTYELPLWESCEYIAGLDEAGRGALAGPVHVGAVILPRDPALPSSTLNLVRDSKQLTPLERSRLAPLIQQTALGWGIGFASPAEIDALGIVPATRLAAMRALEALPLTPQFLLTDFRLEVPQLDIPQTSIVKGDQISLSIACASILAKTARDDVMYALDEQYPDYGFLRHMGYGTRVHLQRIAAFGNSPVHRASFKIKSAE
jgi:ribonuclease HII